MSFIDWVRRSLSGIIGRIDDLASRVRQGLEALFQIMRILNTNVARQWGSLRYQLVNGPRDLLKFLNRAVNIIRWITLDFVPRWVNWAVKKLSAYINDVRHALEGWVKVLWRTLADTFNRGINALRAFVLDWVNNLRRRLDDTIAFLNKIAERVIDLLFNPLRLITWILPHLTGPLFRFIDSRREVIGRWLVDQMLRTILATAPRIESVITRIF